MPELQDLRRGAEADYALGTILGWRAFRVIRWHAVERLSQPFEYDIDLLRTADEGPIDLDALVDSGASFRVATEARWRPIHGVLAEVELVERTATILIYRVRLVPHLWCARYQVHCRTFVEQSLQEIVGSVLEGRAGGAPAGTRGLSLLSGEPTAPASTPSFSDFTEPSAHYRWALVDAARSQVKLPFVVQYNESDLAFVSRLLEAEGISYMFEHTDDALVLTLTDHVEYMSAVEFRHILDELAAEASEEIVVLYSVEWAKHPAHHTNFLAHDRDVFDQLRAIMLVESHLTKVFARIKAELLPESVAAIRHYHGMNGEPHGVDGTRTVETYDGDVEWAMEAVQTRGDMMFRPPLYFPANFIAAGAKIGLVGGSDHSRGGPLKFCLTGFWVEDVTPEAVFASLRRRRTIACASGKLAMWAERFDNAAQVHVASPTPLMSASLWYDGAWHEPVELSGDTRETAELPCETRHLDTPLAVRVEAHPARPDWPSIIGYATL